MTKNFYIASEMNALIPICQTLSIFPKGNYLSSESGKIFQYYKHDWMDYQNVYKNQTNTTQLRNFIEASIKKHLMSDVPYGVLLSGGLNSSIISGITKKFAKHRIEESSKKYA